MIISSRCVSFSLFKMPFLPNSLPEEGLVPTRLFFCRSDSVPEFTWENTNNKMNAVAWSLWQRLLNWNISIWGNVKCSWDSQFLTWKGTSESNYNVPDSWCNVGDNGDVLTSSCCSSGFISGQKQSLSWKKKKEKIKGEETHCELQQSPQSALPAHKTAAPLGTTLQHRRRTHHVRQTPPAAANAAN